MTVRLLGDMCLSCVDEGVMPPRGAVELGLCARHLLLMGAFGLCLELPVTAGEDEVWQDIVRRLEAV